MSLSPKHISEIRKMVSGRVESNVSLDRFTSFRIGGPADLLVEPVTVSELQTLVRFLGEHDEGWIILGSGTNVLFPDKGVRDVVIRMGAMREYELTQNGSDHARIACGAGTALPAVVKRASQSGMTGIEGLWGIPGSFGGAVVINAGSLDTTIGDHLMQIDLVGARGEALTLTGEQIRHSYRSMNVPSGSTVVGGTIRLRRGNLEIIEDNLSKAREKRRSSQPLDRASAGCVFKNPDPAHPAGALIDKLGLKGTTVGGAQISDMHANFIINRGNARACDVLELIAQIRSRVREEYGLDLDLEIQVIGGRPEDAQ